MAIELKRQLAREPRNADVRFDPSSARPVYVGTHDVMNTPTTDDTWMVYKFTYDTTTSSDITRVQKTRGTWDGRAAIAW